MFQAIAAGSGSNSCSAETGRLTQLCPLHHAALSPCPGVAVAVAGGQRTPLAGLGLWLEGELMQR